MSSSLPALRRGLDIFPSPVPDRPGVLMRDPFRFSEEILILPPLLAAALEFFDGESTLLDAQAWLSKLTGQLIPSDILQSMVDVLERNGFLETETFERMRAKRQAEFAAAPTRAASHAGSGYPEDAEALRREFDEYLREFRAPAPAPLLGIAAPHVSPFGGWQSYAAAYGRLSGSAADAVRGKTVVLLGTSHYGQPERFGLTRKSFVTPHGTLQPDLELIDRLEAQAPQSIVMEDYCHAIEHSIEFQAVFLQQMLGNDFKILPILCGPFARALYSGEAPERDDRVMRFFDALGELAEEEAEKLFWVLGIDLAHVGMRYGDDLVAVVGGDEMEAVKAQDEERLALACEGRTEDFFELVKPEQDRLKWCGLSPLYTFLSVQPNARGEVLRYDQWNIDEKSVVSFTAMEFRERS